VAELPTIAEAQQLILERVRPLPAEQIALEEAGGRVLAEAATALIDLPPFPDGLPVVFRIAAGRPAPRPLGPGEAMAIATGGVVPEGADAVIPVEYVGERGNNIAVPEAAVAGANVRPRGGDLRAGDTVVEAGTRLGPAHLGALAAAGVATAVCGAKPRAAVLATGTELRRPGEPLGPGEVYEANGLILAAQLGSAGARVERLAAVADDEEAHRESIARGLEHDVLVTSGGVSVGPHDLVRLVERELGVEEVLWRVAVKPGKPVSFGVRDSTLVFGLPGNPVSSLVGFELFVRPAILALQGQAEPLPRFEPGRLAAAVRQSSDREQLVRARTTPGDGEAVDLEPLTGQESHMIARAAGADALVLVPRGEGELPAGTRVRYLRLAE
jgi:molybdopterin molybdotransferase